MHWLVFFSVEARSEKQSEAADDDRGELAARLRDGDWSCLPARPEVLDFRRDVIASDPSWPSMTLLPRPGDEASDRYLALILDGPPAPEQVRDLRYLAARNRLVLAELG